MTYNTCYTHFNGEPVCITFNIRATVSTNSILGIPTLTSWEMILDLDQNKAFSKTMQIWFPLLFSDSSPGLPIDSSFFSASDFVRPKQQTPSGKAFIIQQKRVTFGITYCPRHDNPLIIDDRTTCLMDFLNVSKTNLTNYQNQSIPQTQWMFRTNLSISSINPVYAWLLYHQRYGDQNSHQNTKHPITTMILTVFLIMQILEIVCFCPYLSWEDVKWNDLI